MTPLTFMALLAASPLAAPPNQSQVIAQPGMPYRVHVFEDYETVIEKRWWLRGTGIEDNLPPSLSKSIANTRVCRAGETKDFDDKMGDPTKTYKAVIFNPVPGPPMGPRTRLSFRYRLKGTDTLRVQIYSLSNNYHRHLMLTDLPQGEWRSATVDMTQARRPDGSGGPLSADERIDDIQFYIAPDAELLIDDIVLYEDAVEGERRPFPRRVIFTGWFDTGKQGAEWPGDFKIVLHDKPRTWDKAQSVAHPDTGKPWLRVHMRGRRPLIADTALRFRYHLISDAEKPAPLTITLSDRQTGRTWSQVIDAPVTNKWTEATVQWRIEGDAPAADDIRFEIDAGVLEVDDLLLHEPG